MLSTEDVARIIASIETGFGLLADTLETGLADIASSIRIQKEEL